MSRQAANKSRGGDKTSSRGAPGGQSVVTAAPVSNDIIPGRLTEADWIQLVIEEDDINFLGSITDEILDKALDECYNKYISNQVYNSFYFYSIVLLNTMMFLLSVFVLFWQKNFNLCCHIFLFLFCRLIAFSVSIF